MDWESEVIAALQASDIDLVAYLPDSVIADLVERLIDDSGIETVLVAREEEAVGILSGAWLGSRRGALGCQSSGLANSITALASLSKADGIPFVGLVSRRGDLGDHNYAQTPGGYAMPAVLDDIGIRNGSLEVPEQARRKVALAAETAFSQEDPYVLMLERMLTVGSHV
jgi:sulfopyruvate decarboxylase alpha subunit